MPPIGSIISNDSKANLLESISRGDVLRILLTEEEGVTPKHESEDSRNKYIIIIGKTDSGDLIGFLLINTNINEHLSEYLKELCYPLRVEKYPFLEKTRYVYCGSLKKIQTKIFNNRYCKTSGAIDDDDMSYIIDALRSSPVVVKKDLCLFDL